MQAATSENRTLNRLPCAIAVVQQGRTATLGEITNISLDGMFVSTEAPLAEGAVLPMVFHLGREGPEIRPEAEVVRRTGEGMGLRFLNLSRQDSRRLRRYLADVSSVIGHRHIAKEHLNDADGRMTAPIHDAAKIRELLTQSAGRAKFTAIPEERTLRETAQLLEVGADALRFDTGTTCELRPGEAIFVLYTHEFISHSFPTTVQSVDGSRFAVAFPTQLHNSERRTAERRPAAAVAPSFRVPLPWRGGEVATWPVVETSSTGLSFRALPQEVYFWPGTALPQATLHGPGGEEPVPQAVVKHLTAMRDADGAEWIKVGVAFGVQRAERTVRDEAMGEAAPGTAPGGFGRVVAWGRDVAAKATYLYHSRVKRIRAAGKEAEFAVVKFANRAGRPIVGLLNRSFPDKAKVRAPVVIITPGFGARKETLSALASVMVHNFRRQHRDVAVMRFDGTNNIGESYKAPGCEGEGRSNLMFTVRDGVDDLLGALAWARQNRFVDPTDIIVISVSFSSIAVRHALTLPETRDVSRWLTFMGAPDAQNAIMNVAGSADGYGAFISGKTVGQISLLGCLVEGDHFLRDMQELGVATLEDARREMAAIRADVTWVIGKHDAFMDPRRVHDIMEVEAPGKREIVQVDAGHVPQSSDEALAEFLLMTRHVWRHLYGRDLEAVMPSKGWIAAVAEQEWERVRHAKLENGEAWWKNYLLGDGGLGFDVWTMTPDYQQLLADQTRLADVAGLRVLDLGAGTGNMSRQLALAGPQSLTAVDLVPEALERARAKVADAVPLTTIAASADGHPRVAMRRYLAGELRDLGQLAARLPGTHQAALEAAASHLTDRLHAYLRGAEVDLATTLRDAGVPQAHEGALRDVHVLARLCQGLIDLDTASSMVSAMFAEVLRSPGGLPFEDASFDCVVCSLVLSYMAQPMETLAEIRRVLVPGGRLVISSMLPDCDASATYVACIKAVEAMPDDVTFEGHSKPEMLDAIRAFLNNGSNLLRLKEEGIFRFWTGPELETLVREAGFEATSHILSSGQPPEAVIVTCWSRQVLPRSTGAAPHAQRDRAA